MTRLQRHGLGVFTILVVLTLWQIAPSIGLVDAKLIPPFGAVLERFGSEWLDRAFYVDLGATLLRVSAGLAIAAAIGIPLGLAMGHWRQVDRSLSLVIDVFRPIPATAFVPVALTLFGIGHDMHIAVVFLAAVIPILFSAHDGAASVDRILVDTATTLGHRGMTTVSAVVLPAAMPHIVTGIRVGIAQALIVAVSSEMILSTNGLGHRVLYAQRLLDITGLYAGVLTLAVVGFVLNRLFLALEQFMVGWDRRAKAKAWN